MKQKYISIGLAGVMCVSTVMMSGFPGECLANVQGNTAVLAAENSAAKPGAVDAVLQSTIEPLRGVWIASVINIDFPKAIGDAAAQKQEIINILNNTQKAGLNAVFFQVRPQGDALYPSKLFPWSEYLTGTAGKDPGYDPLAFMIEEANKRGIQVHAWINPYRLSMGSTAQPKTSLSLLPEGHPVKNRPELTMACQDGKLYLNPGEPEARKLVVEGVKEIIENYNVAGIHFDDYFYPSNPGYNDQAAYSKYGNGLSLEDWRRNNTYTLVKEVYDTIKAIKPSVEFGISPSGIWQNKTSSYLGSETSGFESYSRIYADTRKWVIDGIVDYIAPQLYWTIGQKGSDYAVLSEWWHNVCWETGVKLYIGHAAYKVGTNTPQTWQDPEEMGRQIALNRKLGNVEGSIFYGYAQIANNTLNLRDRLSQLFIDPKAPKELILSYPASGQQTYNENMYLIGSGDPRYPIYLDGKEIPRTVSGHFAVYLPLKVGENSFVFTHQDKTQYYTVNRLKSTAAPSSGTVSPAPKVTILNPQPKAVVLKDDTTVRAKATSDSDRLHPLKKGVTDYAIAESNGYYQLAFGGWVAKSSVSLSQEALPDRYVTQAQVITNAKTTDLQWKLPFMVPYQVSQTDSSVTITLFGTQGRGMLGLTEDNPLFKYTDYYQDGKNAVYTCQLKKAGKMFGYQISYKDGMLQFSFKNPPTLAEGLQPLAGKTIVLDAGHGGSDRGAAGPLGQLTGNEKDLNLTVTLETYKLLQAKGAKVILTRTDDSTVALERRAELIREINPDLSVSLHRNSMGLDKDITNYQGALTLYSDPLSKSFAQVMHQELMKYTSLTDGGMRQQSLAVCRIQECPAILLELGFITNPYDYEVIARNDNTVKEAKAIVSGITKFLSNQW